MNTVIARFHHVSRDPEQLESKLAEAGRRSHPTQEGLDAETAIREERHADEAIANLMAKIEMGVLGHP